MHVYWCADVCVSIDAGACVYKCICYVGTLVCIYACSSACVYEKVSVVVVVLVCVCVCVCVCMCMCLTA